MSDAGAVSAALRGILDALARGDDAAVAGSMLTPMTLSREQSLLYARRLVLGSQLQWLLAEKFGAAAAGRVMVRGQLEFIPRLNPAALKWETSTVSPKSAALGSLQVAIGRPADSADRSRGWVVMARTASGWKLDRSGMIPALLAMHLEDAPWRNSVVQRVADDVKSGKLTSADAAGDALILHAPPLRPDAQKADRSTPEGAIVALFAAMENGDTAVVADSFQYMRESDGGATRRAFAERAVVDRKLVKALRDKFGAEQGARLETNCGLRQGWLDIYRHVPWVVDGEAARAAIEQERYGHRYDVGMRMIRREGIWRIQYPPLDLLDARRSGADRTRRKKDALAHLDQYPTPGSVLDVLDPVRAEQNRDRGEELRQVNEQIDEARKHLATQPAPTPQEAFEQEMQLTVLKLTAALVAGDAATAAKFYFAEGDEDGAYVLAREKRALAVRRMIETADKEIDSGAEGVARELQLIDVADDLYGLVMIEWKVAGDKAVGKKPDGAGDEPFWLPALRRVGGVWKIDVTDEVDGNVKQAAQRASAEARLLDQLLQEIKKQKFAKLDQLKAELVKAGVNGVARPL